MRLLKYMIFTANVTCNEIIDISHLANGMYFLKVDNKMFKIIYTMSGIKKRSHCGRLLSRAEVCLQSPEKRHRHSEQSEESVANFRGLPRRSYLMTRNDGTALIYNPVNLENLNKSWFRQK